MSESCESDKLMDCSSNCKDEKLREDKQSDDELPEELDDLHPSKDPHDSEHSCHSEDLHSSKDPHDSEHSCHSEDLHSSKDPHDSEHSCHSEDLHSSKDPHDSEHSCHSEDLHSSKDPHDSEHSCHSEDSHNSDDSHQRDSDDELCDSKSIGSQVFSVSIARQKLKRMKFQLDSSALKVSGSIGDTDQAEEKEHGQGSNENDKPRMSDNESANVKTRQPIFQSLANEIRNTVNNDFLEDTDGEMAEMDTKVKKKVNMVNLTKQSPTDDKAKPSSLASGQISLQTMSIHEARHLEYESRISGGTFSHDFGVQTQVQQESNIESSDDTHKMHKNSKGKQDTENSNGENGANFKVVLPPSEAKERAAKVLEIIEKNQLHRKRKRQLEMGNKDIEIIKSTTQDNRADEVKKCKTAPIFLRSDEKGKENLQKRKRRHSQDKSKAKKRKPLIPSSSEDEVFRDSDDDGNDSEVLTNKTEIKQMGHRSNLWNFFLRPEKDSIYVTCKICGKKISSNQGSTSGMKKHINTHPNQFAAFRKLEKEKGQNCTPRMRRKHSNPTPTFTTPRESSCSLVSSQNSSSTVMTPSLDTPVSILSSQQSNISQQSNVSSSQQSIKAFDATPYKRGNPRAKTITNCITHMIALDFQPYSIVEDRGFRRLMNTLDPRYKIPTRQTFSSVLVPNLYDEKVKLVKEIMELTINERCPAVSFTTDLWTSRSKESYISFVVQYLDNDWKLQTFQLENRELVGESHNWVAIKESLEESMDNWFGADGTQVPIFCVRDNGGNIKKALEQMRDGRPVHDVPCAIHTLQLVVKDAIKCNEVFSTLTNKAKRLVNYYVHSTTGMKRIHKISRSLGKTELTFVTHSETRWNSEFLMFDRLLQLKEEINDDLVRYKTDLSMTTTEWIIMNDYRIVLKPFYEATLDLSTNKMGTRSLLIPILYGIHKHLDALIMKESRTPCVKDHSEFLDDLKSGLDSRFRNYKKAFPDLLCTFLNPRYKESFTTLRDVKEQFNSIAHMYFPRCREVALRNNLENIQPAYQPSSELLRMVHEELDSNLPRRPRNARELSIYTVITEECDRYAGDITLKSDSAELFWGNYEDKYPSLSVFAKAFLSIPASQVDSERLNSTSGNIITERRSRLDPMHVQQLTFLNKNL